MAAANAAPGRTVGIVFAPGAVLLPWSNNSNVSAAIAMFLPGLEGGHAVADVVFGDVNPTGSTACHLSEPGERGALNEVISSGHSLAPTDDSR